MRVQVLTFLQEHAREMRSDLQQLVELESPSDEPLALRRCAAFLADRAAKLTGGDIRVVEESAGPHLDIVVGNAKPDVLILGHFDTVWPIGTIAERPYTEKNGIAFGPGIFDMKAGIVQGLWAVHALQRLEGRRPSVRIIFNSDEEVQSRRSRPLIESAARQSTTVLVLEPSLAGALKTARKGTGRYEVTIRGRAAHAGVDPASGCSAISELARVIEYLQGLASADGTTTVNVGVVSGGSRANVVAAEARASVDVRVADQSEAARLNALLIDLRPSQARIEIAVTGGFERPPMPRSPAIATLFGVARRIGESIGLQLEEASTGGGSDANFCAALGVPVLDGLGAVGGGAHAVDEHVILEAMPARAALTAGLIGSCSDNPLAE